MARRTVSECPVNRPEAWATSHIGTSWACSTGAHPRVGRFRQLGRLVSSNASDWPERYRPFGHIRMRNSSPTGYLPLVEYEQQSKCCTIRSEEHTSELQ